MSKRKSTIEDFFKRKKPVVTSDSLTFASATENQDDVAQTPHPLSKIIIPGTSTHLEVYHNECYECDRLDIGLYVGRDLSNKVKHSLLKNAWTPPELYKFPPGQRNLKFQRKWLAEFPWLAYSKFKGGAKEIKGIRLYKGTEYYTKFSVMAQNFISVHENKSADVTSQIDSARKMQVVKNRKKSPV